jgi:hypothetical protein
MIVEFGSRLRKELTELYQRTEVLRSRDASTDTQRMSLDSLRAPEEVTLDPKCALEGMSYNLKDAERLISLEISKGSGRGVVHRDQTLSDTL